jgi:hypothetical protein
MFRVDSAFSISGVKYWGSRFLQRVGSFNWTTRSNIVQDSNHNVLCFLKNNITFKRSVQWVTSRCSKERRLLLPHRYILVIIEQSSWNSRFRKAHRLTLNLSVKWNKKDVLEKWLTDVRKKVNKWVTNPSCDLRFLIKCGELSPLDGSTI